MGLEAIDYGLVAMQNFDNICCFSVPDKEFAIVRSGNDKIAFAAKYKKRKSMTKKNVFPE
jgi:hypothetical protein